MTAKNKLINYIMGLSPMQVDKLYAHLQVLEQAYWENWPTEKVIDAIAQTTE